VSTYYHGSRQKGLKTLLPTAITGVEGPTDGQRTQFRDVVFLTTSLETARIYAGSEGSVYEVEPEGLLPYVEAYKRLAKGPASKLRRKLRKFASRHGDVFVCRTAKVRRELP